MRHEGEGAPPRDPGEDTDELTVVDDEWPVPPQYRESSLPEPAGDTEVVTPADAPAPAEAPTEAVAAPPPGPVPPGAPGVPPPVDEERRFSAALAAGLIAILLALLAGGAVLAYTMRDDDEGEAARPDTTQPTTTTPPGTTGTTGTGTTDTTGTTGTTETTETTQTTGPRAVSVPDLAGLTLAEARRLLERRGLEARVREAAADAPAGEIVRQDPAAGQEAERGTTVILVVSSGPEQSEQVAVPDVVGSSRANAIATLRDAGLAVEVRTRASQQPAGTVVEQSPGAGTQVDAGATVRLVVATRPQPTLVRVPNVRGVPVADARAQLRDAGLRSTVTRVPSSRPAGTVVSQSPRAGASVREASVVRLQVSSGPALVSVPDVVGLDEAAARDELTSAGFRVTVTEEETTDPNEDGVVTSQSPSGGERAERGTTVTITVARLA